MSRVAIVHDWLTGMRGGERVLEAMLDVVPDAEIFTLLHVAGSVSRRIESRPIHTSFLQRAPGVATAYRSYLPLFPLAIRGLDLEGFDLVVSSSHCVAKSARSPRAPHLCYCHTPIRYAWDQFDAYFPLGSAGVLTRTAARPAAAALRRWDASTAGRVDHFLANSHHVRRRIRAFYGREARVLYPPVDTVRFTRCRVADDFWLVLGALVPYKRVELAVRAFNRLGARLLVAGDGPERSRLEAIAGPSIEFLGRVSDEAVEDLLSRCRALVFPGVEDFGITPVEALAAGAPVIARAAGGALETVRGPIVAACGDVVGRSGEAPDTGVFFESGTPEALIAALRTLERMRLDERTIRDSARAFDASRFRAGFRRHVSALVREAA